MNDWHYTPVFVTNFNNLERGFRRLLAWLRAAGYDNVTVVDNASTWPPLLEFYDRSPEVAVLRLTREQGPVCVLAPALAREAAGAVCGD